MAGLIDPTAAGKYPVILGDGLLGKTSNDIFTGIRCMFAISRFCDANRRAVC